MRPMPGTKGEHSRDCRARRCCDKRAHVVGSQPSLQHAACTCLLWHPRPVVDPSRVHGGYGGTVGTTDRAWLRVLAARQMRSIVHHPTRHSARAVEDAVQWAVDGAADGAVDDAVDAALPATTPLFVDRYGIYRRVVRGSARPQWPDRRQRISRRTNKQRARNTSTFTRAVWDHDQMARCRCCSCSVSLSTSQPIIERQCTCRPHLR